MCTICMHHGKAQEKVIANMKFVYEYTTNGFISSGLLKDMYKASIDSTETEEQKHLFEQLKAIVTNGIEHKAKISVQYKNDTVWHRKHENDSLVKNFKFKKDATTMIFYYNDREFDNRLIDFFDAPKEYEIIKNKGKRKKIMGIECYFVKIVEKERNVNKLDFDFGKEVFEMYVTEAINLPVHAVLLDIEKKFDNFFPLEIKSYHDKYNKSFEFYKLKSIDLN